MSRSLGVLLRFWRDGQGSILVVRDPLPRGGGWREEQRMGGNSELRPVLEHARRSGEVGGYVYIYVYICLVSDAKMNFEIPSLHIEPFKISRIKHFAVELQSMYSKLPYGVPMIMLRTWSNG